MSYHADTAQLSWQTLPIRWSNATFDLLDTVQAHSYDSYPDFDRALNGTEAGLVRLAFDAWSAVSGIVFQEVADGPDSQIRLGVDAIDGRGDTLGQATYWWMSGRSLEAAAIAFDSGDLVDAWMSTTPPPSSQWSFYSTAVHEIGHAIGIPHLAEPDAVMYPYANGTTTLTAADVAEVVARYGVAAAVTPEPVAPAPDALTVAPPATGPALPTAVVDAGFYLARNPDVAAAGMNPQDHYMQHGWREGRDPVAWFDTSWYLQSNTDVAAAGMEAYSHFVGHGVWEGRDPNAWLDTSWYFATYTDIAAAGINPAEHYWAHGWREGRDPTANFDTSAYLDRNPDVQMAGMNPLEHWLLYGQAEGRALA